ncbi:MULTISPECIES: hypothetical protein [unclassified Chryseobacterium]|uniref:hypothetical protein n=1 Tax=unclassified Chryseobacterium TaxID=2593645 RepID=UPI00100A3EEB|nr:MULTISPECIES: hypothetical protein [unclassified Chryseobacterium]RXM53443.1 hypothetical protein BOQ64_03525 [Chryseobacterium sp. CH25]RXM65356.1 hypothetical protein BOQ60_05965 [Chryseobacterium sp. CH1]
MVNKSVLRKLSDSELEKYLKEGNRFVPESVQMAFEILNERGRSFTEQEKIAVHKLIQSKKTEEEAKSAEEKELWRDHITEDSNAIKLFPREMIFIISIILGTIPGAILLGLNLIKLKKYGPAVLTFIFGFVFLFIQNGIVSFMYKGSTQSIYSYRKSPELFIAIVGALILLVFWVLFTPKKLPYRAASYIVPIIICTIMAFLITINYQGLFSSYLLVSFAK